MHMNICKLLPALSLVLGLGCAWPLMGDVPEYQKAEVRHLIDYLRSSDCVLIRNGKSHNGEDGAKHVQRKYDYFRNDISSTEEFIELSATKSTMSSKLYRVQCPGEAPQTSRDWLLQELGSYRSK